MERPLISGGAVVVVVVVALLAYIQALLVHLQGSETARFAPFMFPCIPGAMFGFCACLFEYLP